MGLSLNSKFPTNTTIAIRRIALLPALIIFCTFFLPYLLVAQQILAPQRATDWYAVGLQVPKIEPELVINILDQGGFNDGLSPNDQLVKELLLSHASKPFVLYFPPGTYQFTQPLILPARCIIRGASADSSILQFYLLEPDHLIQVQGQITRDTAYLKTDATIHDQFVRINTPSQYQIGDYLKLIDQDSALITSSWAQFSTGQLLQITQIQGDSLYFDHPLRRDFLIHRGAHLIRFEPKFQVGIEQLQIKRLDATDRQTSNIYFKYAANCWVSCVKSVYCNFAHVELNHSTHIELSGSHFQEAHAYGGGGKAYGVMLHFASGNSLIQDNSFQKLRHSMILQAGANGNVIAYNYSTEPYWTDVNLPTDAAGDLVLHGNYPYANLFEGNVVQNIVVDHSHGINGPYNTFFRNRAELYGIFMNQEPSSNWQNFLGNEIPNSGLFLGNYLLAGEGLFEYANNVQGSLRPQASADLMEKSLFLGDISGQSPSEWALIGPPSKLNEYKITAQIRFESQLSNACAEPIISTSVEATLKDLDSFYLFSDQAQNTLEIRNHEQIDKSSILSLYSIQGELILQSQASSLEIGHLASGLYIVRQRRKDGTVLSAKWRKDW
ncbi:MAG: glycosyl hydrolase family 28-related protein [Bacteroidia bacterium]